MSLEECALVAMECSFCRKFGNESSSEREWFDVSLLSTNELVVVPGLGIPDIGYVLIVPRQHYLSIAGLPPSILEHVRQVKALVSTTLSTRFGSIVFFEHGPGAAGASSGNCIDHAHLHALPTSIDVVMMLNQFHALTPCDDLADLTRLARDAYLYVEQDGRGFVVSPVTRLPGQYMHRLLALGRGTPAEWDYALFPHNASIAQTISALSPWPSPL